MAAARSAGLAVERGKVVAVAANVLVRLEPGPIAARMSGATSSFRDSAQFLGREARLASAAAAAGAPVLAPLGGPYEAGESVVTLWPWVDTVASGAAVAAGRALRACHDALLGVDGAGLGLEPLGMLREARRLAVRAPDEVAEAVDRGLELVGGVGRLGGRVPRPAGVGPGVPGRRVAGARRRLRVERGCASAGRPRGASRSALPGHSGEGVCCARDVGDLPQTARLAQHLGGRCRELRRIGLVFRG